MGPIWAHMGPYGPYGPIWAHMGPIWAHMGPYGAHMGPYTRKIPKNTQKFLGIPRDLCGDLCGSSYKSQAKEMGTLPSAPQGSKAPPPSRPQAGVAPSVNDIYSSDRQMPEADPGYTSRVLENYIIELFIILRLYVYVLFF